MILDNGIVRTLDPSVPTQRALAIAGDRIAGGVGVHEWVLPTPERVDLRGRCVLPGFADAHVHIVEWSLAQREVRLEGARSLDEALARVAAAPGTGWIRGGGWREQEWSGAERPASEKLDAVAGGRPAALWSRDRHSLWLSSAALRLAGDAVGEDGVLREEAAARFYAEVAVPSEAERLDALRAGVRLAASRGVVSVHDFDGGLGALPLLHRLREDDLLPLRVWQSLPHERLDALAAAGLPAGLGDDRLRLGFVKVFMDGALGSGTALMLDGSGVEVTTRAELEDIVRRAALAGFPVAVHAIGDRANRNALDAFEATLPEWAPLGLRQRIEHAQCLAPADLPRFAALGVAASVQFSHAPSDRDLADEAWAGSLDGAYAYRSLVESGAVVANGSDAPIEELDPLAGVRSAVLRTLDDRPAWRPGEALTVQQALEASIAAPARLAGDERRRGRLVPGMLADLVVLDRDPVSCPAAELPEVRVVATMLGGRWAHNPPPW